MATYKVKGYRAVADIIPKWVVKVEAEDAIDALDQAADRFFSKEWGKIEIIKDET